MGRSSSSPPSGLLHVLPDSIDPEPNGSRFNLPRRRHHQRPVTKATTHTTAVFANGITDRWDIGLAVPFVKVILDASVTARILRLHRPASGRSHHTGAASGGSEHSYLRTEQSRFDADRAAFWSCGWARRRRRSKQISLFTRGRRRPGCGRGSSTADWQSRGAARNRRRAG